MQSSFQDVARKRISFSNFPAGALEARLHGTDSKKVVFRSILTSVQLSFYTAKSENGYPSAKSASCTNLMF